MHFLSLLSWLYVAHICGISCYPNGAPDDFDACSLLTPSHGYSAQTSDPPYRILVSDTSFTESGSLTVTLTGQSQFKGFILQARSSATNSPVGSFVSDSCVQQTCQLNGGASVTHIDDTPKSSVVLTWTAPSGSITDVIFVATLVESFDRFWTTISSSTIKASIGAHASQQVKDTPLTRNSRASISQISEGSDVDISTCGVSKGCFVSSCTNDGCYSLLTWSDAGDNVAFELSGVVLRQQSYLAVGYSHDRKMGDDSVTSCIYDTNSGNVTIRMSYNDDEDNIRLPNDTVSLVSGSMSGGFANGHIYCRFSRPKLPPGSANGRKKRQSGQVFYPGSMSYHIMITNGPLSSGGSGISRHYQDPDVSSSLVNLTDFTAYVHGSDVKKNLVKAHGVFMIFAWMVFASFGMILPRYFKSAWSNKKWFGKQIWFQLHQPCMIVSFLFTAIAFILIFIKARSYSKLDSPGVAHPPLGIIVMILVTLNPIMAFFRPEPNSDRRWIFNICHFAVGLLSHLFSVIVIFLSTYILEAFSSVNQWSRWVMVAYICWHAFFEIFFAIHIRITSQKKGSPTASVAMNDFPEGNHSGELKLKGDSVDEGSGLKTLALVVYVCGVFGFALAMSIGVGIS